MLRFFVLLYVAALYVRPGEIIPAAAGLPLIDYLSMACALVALGSLLLDLRSFWNQPHDRYFLLFFLVIVVSNPAWGYMQGGYDAFFAFLPVVFCYFLIRLGIRTQRDVVTLVVLLVSLNVFLALNGVIQAKTGYGFGGVEVYEGAGGVRIRGTGIFNDPNDLGMTLVTAVPILLSAVIAKGSGFLRRFAATAGLAIVLTACFYTNSRGTVLGLGAVMAVFSYRRLGIVPATLLAVVGVAGLLAFGPSRTAEISSDEASAQGRIQAWIAGFDMLKSSPLFGVGYGRFMEYHERVAHNSFVHVLGDLGLAGGFALVGMFYWYFQGLRGPGAPGLADAEQQRLSHWTRDLTTAGVGMLTCMFFLSRQYTVVVYVMLAVAACQATLVNRPPTGGIANAMKIAAILAGLVIFVFLVSRTLVQF